MPPKVAPEVSYSTSMRETDTASDVLEGAIRREVKIILWRHDTPTAKPIKVGVRTVKGWTLRAATRKAKACIPELIEIDRQRRRIALRDQIARLERAARKRS